MYSINDKSIGYKEEGEIMKSKQEKRESLSILILNHFLQWIIMLLPSLLFPVYMLFTIMIPISYEMQLAYFWIMDGLLFVSVLFLNPLITAKIQIGGEGFIIEYHQRKGKELLLESLPNFPFLFILLFLPIWCLLLYSFVEFIVLLLDPFHLTIRERIIMIGNKIMEKRKQRIEKDAISTQEIPQ